MGVDDASAALSTLGQLPKEWLTWYDENALQYPLTTKSATAGACFAIGDLCAQGLMGKNLSTLDAGRFARSGIVGAIGYGPAAHYYLEWLNNHMSFGGARWAVLPKLALTSGPLTVLVNALHHFTIESFEFGDPREALRQFQVMFRPNFIKGIRFWPVIDFLNFAVIPLELQVLWYGNAKIIYLCILSGVEGFQKARMVENKAA